MYIRKFRLPNHSPVFACGSRALSCRLRWEKHINDLSSPRIPKRPDDKLPASVAAEAGDARIDENGKTSLKRTRTRGGKNIIFRVFPEEHDDISARAAEAGLTVSEFIRRIALGYKTQSRFDYDVIEHLIHIHTDMNRLGNLFKMSLKQDGDGNGASLSYMDRERQRSVLQSIEDNQELLRNYIGGSTT